MNSGQARALYEQISATIREHMGAASPRMLQQDLAAPLGRTDDWASSRLRNRTRWTIEDVYDVARVLGVHPTEILPPVGPPR